MIHHEFQSGMLRGCAELERTDRGWLPHRLPTRARAQCDDPQLLAAESQPSGVRLTLTTAATAIELDVHRTRVVLTGVPERPAGIIDLVVDHRLTAQAATSAGDAIHIDPATGATRLEAGAIATVRFAGLRADVKEVEIWLPHYEKVELVALRTDAPVEVSSTSRQTWVHHGSSISQGSNAASPSTTWAAIAAAQAGVELVNFGFSGSALLDPFVARAIADQPADVISVKLGINLVNADLMRRRAFAPAVHGFLDTIRDGHPETPLIVVGPLYCPIHENTPGPVSFDADALRNGVIRFIADGDPAEATRSAGLGGRLTLTYIRERLAEIVAGRRDCDPLVSYVDGLALYGPDDEPNYPLPDHLHPDAGTHRLIGGRFAELATIPAALTPKMDTT